MWLEEKNEDFWVLLCLTTVGEARPRPKEKSERETGNEEAE